ncbi:hypothetical protein DICPUDRAFT_153334 [Dictyostelium purpureum]|uniref:EF-hand domain-containing protein n=1 Tax=Dictyostelium purpureum TaxID=5786 RepID=F0ZNM5_DICPU|nr:uncharacterized protein DICPUDRAFT_153334 [Dictyostelium purpureum]EGC34434.1 hypothetical protein DICPUDRAFT_153334 [Dictyostelium purpureum]|eukprot:XP_003289019.1 hypothetical protein DICPUDRAFT_153334 [Dictyostelium purpureum]
MENKAKRRLSIVQKFESPKKIRLSENLNDSIYSEKNLNDQDSHILDIEDIDLNAMSEDDYRQSKELFEIFDFDTDGLISKNDLEIVLNGLGEENSPEFVNLMFSEINNDTKNHDFFKIQDGKHITYSQFCIKYMNIKYLDIEQHLKSSFDIFEENNSEGNQGFIKIEELGQLLSKLAGDNLSQEDISSLVKECIDIENKELMKTDEEEETEKIKFETFLTVMMKKFKKNILQRQPSGLISKSSIPTLRRQNSNNNSSDNNSIEEFNKLKSLENENSTLSIKIKELEKSLEIEKRALEKKLIEQQDQIQIQKEEKEKLLEINQRIEQEKHQIQLEKQVIEKEKQFIIDEDRKLKQQREREIIEKEKKLKHLQDEHKDQTETQNRLINEGFKEKQDLSNKIQSLNEVIFN